MYTIHLEATASEKTARAALARAPQGEVALVFPWGKPCALCDLAQLDALYNACLARGILPVIVGGDQQLRAHAVAVGFAAATSLEEWETSKHRAIRARREELAIKRPRHDQTSPTELPMRVVGTRSPTDAESDGQDLYSLDSGDPPAYVADLVAQVGATQVERLTGVPTVPVQRGRKTRVLDETIRDRREAEALERAQQLFEERLTQIVRTSGIPASETASPPTPPGSGRDADN